ncbi:hypothetical protein IKF12_03335 [Candidatus Saccharibacteria bacterium]|nr:hypothetical protein [Candidatus Saccharibacteria bacterium]
MKNIAKLILPVLLCGIITVFGVANVAHATDAALTTPSPLETTSTTLEAVHCDGCPTDLFGEHGVFKQITNTILYIVGILAVIMLIIGGIRYVVSGGDSKKVTDAKNTILYAIIGLIICFLAFAIVNFVIAALPSSGA